MLEYLGPLVASFSLTKASIKSVEMTVLAFLASSLERRLNKKKWITDKTSPYPDPAPSSSTSIPSRLGNSSRTSIVSYS